ncbi:hypothetical protein DFJ74DRAFT_722050 [Hyaloraphidium curvatum]|nr:hypothetical protein DFJ74DRAFT_722050 [Hyaloraphidium curvatum]
MASAALLAALSLTMLPSARAAPRWLTDEDVQEFVRLHRRQLEGGAGAGILIAIIFVGLVAVIGGCLYVWLRGNKKRQAWFRKNVCCCCPEPKVDESKLEVYNGYGERLDPNAKVDVPSWQVDQTTAGTLTASEAVALMQRQAAEGQVLGSAPQFEVPSVQALQQTTGYHAAELQGTKVAKDLGLEEAARAASEAVPEEATKVAAAVGDAADAVAGSANQAAGAVVDAANHGVASVTNAANQGAAVVADAANQGAAAVTNAAAAVTK